MARVIQFQRNPWGVQATAGSEEPQRSDLWVVDLSSPIRGISTVLNVNQPPIPPYFAQSVSLPELRVRPDVVRRDSRPYNMPSWDDPLDAVKITFILDAPEGGNSSRIYSLLSRWRTLVRAGRGSMSNEVSIPLNNNYRIDFQYNVTLHLLRGGHAAINSAQQQTDIAVINQALAIVRQQNQEIFTLQTDNTNTIQNQAPLSVSEQAEQDAAAARQASAAAASTALLVSNSVQLSSVDNDLQYAGSYTIKNAWLGAFRMSDFTYGPAQVGTIEATFYAEDVLDLNANDFE